MIASAIARVSVGSTRMPDPVSLTIARIPGRSDTTPGTPAAIASNSFWGVVSRWLRVSPWIGIAATSADATQSWSWSGGTAPITRTLPPVAGSASHAFRVGSRIP